MRSGVWLGVLGIFLNFGCNTTYEAQPTACDDYCKITYGYECREYEPAQCVQRCEIQNSQGKLDCSDARAAVVRCTQEHTDAVDLYCSQFDQSPCAVEVRVLNDCSVGISRDSSVCSFLCDKLVNSACPHQDGQSCISRCLAEGMAAPECQTERDAVLRCGQENYQSCVMPVTTLEPPPAPPFDPEVLPCKAEHDALKSCGLATFGSGAAGAGGSP